MHPLQLLKDVGLGTLNTVAAIQRMFSSLGRPVA